MKPRKPGSVAANKIPIFDHKCNVRGAVGPLATSVTVARFTGTHGAKLGRKAGRQAWLGAKPLGDTSAAETTAGAPAPQPETADHAAARGSVKKRSK